MTKARAIIKKYDEKYEQISKLLSHDQIYALDELSVKVVNKQITEKTQLLAEMKVATGSHYYTILKIMEVD